MSTTWIVTPTYNEREHIHAHIASLRHVVPAGKILVVDDSSPDGTGQIVQDIAKTDDSVQLLTRRAKTGLGDAYAEGLQFALDHGATHIVHLDADGSHPVEMVPDMLAALADVHLAIGSRYVRGGSMDIDIFRRQVSNVGNMYIRGLLGRSLHDWSTGFKAWRGDMLRRVLNVPPRAHGYAWLMETSWLAVRHGAQVRELPLVFRARQAGASKFSLKIAAEDLTVAWELSRRTLAE